MHPKLIHTNTQRLNSGIRKMLTGFPTQKKSKTARLSTEHINRHIIRMGVQTPCKSGPLSSLAGCQPRALEVAGSNPAGPIGILGYEQEKTVMIFLHHIIPTLAIN
jgi:hypothetical protein